MATSTAAPVPFVALIPARMASSRLPGKPLADIGGLPMVIRVAHRAHASGASRVVIATDEPAVAAAAARHSVECVMTRADHPSGTDRLAEAADLADAVAQARTRLGGEGVILLSPGAPSFGSYRDYTERGRHFATLAGFDPDAIAAIPGLGIG